MDITSFIIQGRDKALLYGDYSTYHGQLSKRLLNSRRKLGTVTKNRGKFRKAEQATAEDVKTNNEYDITFCLLSLFLPRVLFAIVAAVELTWSCCASQTCLRASPYQRTCLGAGNEHQGRPFG